MPWKEATTMYLRSEFIHLTGIRRCMFPVLFRRKNKSKTNSYLGDEWIERLYVGDILVPCCRLADNGFFNRLHGLHLWLDFRNY